MGVINPNKFTKLAKSIAEIEFELFPNRKNVHISFILFGKSYVYGINSTKTHPNIYHNYGGFKSCLHSEMAVLLKIQNITEKQKTLVNFRYSRSSELPLMSKPCIYCQQWIPEVFTNVYYSGDDGKLIKMY